MEKQQLEKVTEENLKAQHEELENVFEIVLETKGALSA